jgi:hypothetical protein
VLGPGREYDRKGKLMLKKSMRCRLGIVSMWSCEEMRNRGCCGWWGVGVVACIW